jgi:sugar transferase EpsL
MGNNIPRRAADILVSSTGLVVASLPLLFAAAAVGVTMGRPIVFKQKRYGLNGRPFTIYKIRTMTNDLREDGQLLPDQQRKTRVGSFLRRAGIDELPQFWNIIKGDMSLIGPRPMSYEPPIAGWDERYKIKPGLSGLAQIREKKLGRQPPLEERLGDDLEYINRRSFLFDMRLLFRTAAVVVAGRIDPPRHPVHAVLMQAALKHDR